MDDGVQIRLLGADYETELGHAERAKKSFLCHCVIEWHSGCCILHFVLVQRNEVL